ncbi:MAG: RecB family exonuclease [Acidimicrobiia bacterium]
MALTVPGSLSPSKVSSFRDCALAFRFSVIDHLPEPPTAPAAKGTAVHRALELLFGLPPAARTLDAAVALVVPAVDEVLASDEYAALELPDRAAFVASAEELVRRYFRLEDPTRINPVGLELMLEAEVRGVRLRGIIDRLDEGPDGALVVTDYKTGRVPGERFEQGKLGGVQFYAYLCEQALGRRPSRVQLLYLAEPVAIVAEPSDESIGGLTRRVGAIWAAVERACEREDFRPNPGRLCDWCAFKAHCPAFGGDPTSARLLAATA